MAELKPCPFCGGKPFVSAKLPFFGETPTVAVVCGDCNASSKHKRAEDEAIEAWNRRMKDGERICPFDGQLVVCDSDCDHCDYAKMGEV